MNVLDAREIDKALAEISSGSYYASPTPERSPFLLARASPFIFYILLSRAHAFDFAMAGLDPAGGVNF